MKNLTTLIFATLFLNSLIAQHEPLNPYESIGKKTEVLTLSKGKFQETFANDTIQPIGTLPFTDYATAQHWRAQTTLYRSLRENPSLLGQDNDVDAFYSNAANGTIGIFQTVAEGISALGVPDVQAAQSYASLEAQVSSKLGELASVDAQLLAASGTAYDGLVAQRRTVSMEIFGLQQSLLALDSSVQAARVARAEQLLAWNASASAVTLPQQCLKAVNQVYLNTVGKGVLELTIEQVGVLQPIANTCVHEGGDAVLGARELLKLDGDESEYDDSKLCTPPQLLVQPGQGGHWQASGGLAVFPNPAKGQVEIKFPEADRERLLQVFNQQGILVRSVVVAEGQAGEVLSLDDVPSGIYHVSIKGGDLMLAQKLVVLK